MTDSVDEAIFEGETYTGRKDRWTQDDYLRRRCEFVNETAGCIRRLGVDSRCNVDSYRLATVMFDYAFFYACQANDVTVINPDIEAMQDFNRRDWLASFTLIFMKVKRLVEGYQPPAVYSGQSMNGEQLWSELKCLQEDMTVLLGNKKGRKK